MALSLYRDLLNDMDQPPRLLDQYFNMGLTPADMVMPLSVYPRSNYYRPWRTESTDMASTMHVDKNNFRVELDVQHFKPEEVSVKVADGFVTVEGSHEEKRDEHGYVSRQFMRKYMVPEGFNADALACSLSSDGVLTMTAPKISPVEENKRTVPITHTRRPHRPVKHQPHSEMIASAKKTPQEEKEQKPKEKK